MDASVYSLWTNAEHELSLRRNDRSGSLLNEVVVGRFATGDFQAVLVSETHEHSTVAVGFVTRESRYRAHVLLVSVEDGRVDLLHEQSSGQMGGPVRIVDARGSPSIVVTLEGELHDELIRIDVATQRVVATTPLGRDEDGSGLIGQILCAVGDIDGDGTEDLALCNWKLGAPYRPGTRVQLRSGVDLALLRELGPPQDELDAVPAITPPARTDKK
jgi:hypothetical protein